MDIRDNGQNKYWSNRANTYGHQYGLDNEIVKLKIRRKVDLMSNIINFCDGDIIELGCGTGLFTKEFSRFNRLMLATDISNEMINTAKKYCPDVNFQQVDGRKVYFKDKSFNVVVSAFLLQHVEIESVVPEMYRILKDGGYFGAFVPNILNPMHYSRAKVGFMRKILKEDSHSVDFNRKEWIQLMKDFKFEDIKVTSIEFTSPYLPVSLFKVGTKISELLESIPLFKEYAGTLMITARK